MPHFKHIYVYILFGVFACYSIFFIYFSSSCIEEDLPLNFTKTLPIILTYNLYFGKTFFDPLTIKELKKCKYKCQYLENKKYYPYADIALFHARDVQMDSLLSSNKNPNRLHVLFSMEAEPNAKLSKNIPNNFFNITMTFRQDSTIWVPYDKFEEIKDDEKGMEDFVWNNEQINRIIAKKTKLALQFVSNCKTHSKREKYLAELQKYSNITSYGACNNNYIPDELIKNECDKHYFYLAFENSICNSYVTEKFWRLKNLIVPIVLKRSVLKGIIDDQYFIAADDFDSPEGLATKLKNLTQNLEEYKKYFGWTKKYKKNNIHFSKLKNFCKLCEIATKKEKHQIDNIHRWWTSESKCEPNFALKISGTNNSWFFNSLFQ